MKLKVTLKESNPIRLLIWLLVLLLTLLSYKFIVAQTRQGLHNSVAQTNIIEAAGDLINQVLPFGGNKVLPAYRFVGLYGTPSMPELGALGQQSVAATIKRVKKLAAKYQPYSEEKIVPTLEIIATVASSGPTSNSDYSQEIDLKKLRPLIKAAKDAEVYVVLDLQPGRSNFLKQAKLYKSLLKEPHVGLALDPEWRLKPNQVHLRQIGSVGSSEVDQVSTWLADLVATEKLPQKIFLLHQFKLSMLPGRHKINTSRKELAFVIQMDGQGNQNVKQDTWRILTAKPPENSYFGWKNFYKKDSPLRSAKDTMGIEPKPWFVSYQ